MSTCAGMVWYKYDYYSCGKNAAYEHEGKHYCKTHHPPTVAAKRAAKEQVWYAKWDTEQEEAVRQKTEAAEQKRRANLYPELLAALIKCVEQLEMITGKVHDERCALVDAKVAIAKATGTES